MGSFAGQSSLRTALFSRHELTGRAVFVPLLVAGRTVLSAFPSPGRSALATRAATTVAGATRAAAAAAHFARGNAIFQPRNRKTSHVRTPQRMRLTQGLPNMGNSGRHKAMPMPRRCDMAIFTIACTRPLHPNLCNGTNSRDRSAAYRQFKGEPSSWAGPSIGLERQSLLAPRFSTACEEQRA
jgi:hypothetical protein